MRATWQAISCGVTLLAPPKLHRNPPATRKGMFQMPRPHHRWRCSFRGASELLANKVYHLELDQAIPARGYRKVTCSSACFSGHFIANCFQPGGPFGPAQPARPGPLASAAWPWPGPPSPRAAGPVLAWARARCAGRPSAWSGTLGTGGRSACSLRGPHRCGTGRTALPRQHR